MGAKDVDTISQLKICTETNHWRLYNKINTAPSDREIIKQNWMLENYFIFTGSRIHSSSSHETSHLSNLKKIQLKSYFAIPSIINTTSGTVLSCHHIETSQLICPANQLAGFYMMATLAFNWYHGNISLHRTKQWISAISISIRL